MLLLTIIYDNSMEDFINEINEIKNLFKVKDIKLGISENLENDIHVVKVYSADEKCDSSLKNTFNLYMSMSLYNIMVKKFYNEKLKDFIIDKYFFFKDSEVNYLVKKVYETLNSDKIIMEKNGLYFINKKNDILQEIINCIKEVNEFNINGFIRFRTSKIEKSFFEITEEVVQNYISEKEYKEFIKLLKYFVQLQESKIDEVNIIIGDKGKYYIKNKQGKDIFNELVNELEETSFSGTVSIEDIIISGLITNVPKRIVIHNYDKYSYNEFINTIKDVFVERVAFCTGCPFCKKNKDSIKL